MCEEHLNDKNVISCTRCSTLIFAIGIPTSSCALSNWNHSVGFGTSFILRQYKYPLFRPLVDTILKVTETAAATVLLEIWRSIHAKQESSACQLPITGSSMSVASG